MIDKATQVYAVNKEYNLIVGQIRSADVARSQKVIALQRLHTSKVKAVANIYGNDVVKGVSIDDYEGV